MLRKLTLGLFATTAFVAAAALVPTAASAHGWHGGWGHHGWHGGFGFGGPVFVGGYADDGCYRARRVLTPRGYRWRTVNVCY